MIQVSKSCFFHYLFNVLEWSLSSLHFSGTFSSDDSKISGDLLSKDYLRFRNIPCCQGGLSSALSNDTVDASDNEQYDSITTSLYNWFCYRTSRLTVRKPKDRQADDDEKEAGAAAASASATATATAITATATTGEGNDCVGSICIVLVLVKEEVQNQYYVLNQINDMKFMWEESIEEVFAQRHGWGASITAFSGIHVTPTPTPTPWLMLLLLHDWCYSNSYSYSHE